jgi:hypothetical protein
MQQFTAESAVHTSYHEPAVVLIGDSFVAQCHCGLKGWVAVRNAVHFTGFTKTCGHRNVL